MNLPDEIPLPRGWWIEPVKILGGPSPVMSDPQQTGEILQQLLQAGFRVFISLQEVGENTSRGVCLPEYESTLKQIASDAGITAHFHRFAVTDGETPSDEQLTQIRDLLHAAIAEGKRAYVHCWAGYGRTGCVAWSWLVAHGLTSAEALNAIKQQRAHDPALRSKDAPGFLQVEELERRLSAKDGVGRAR